MSIVAIVFDLTEESIQKAKHAIELFNTSKTLFFTTNQGNLTISEVKTQLSINSEVGVLDIQKWNADTINKCNMVVFASNIKTKEILASITIPFVTYPSFEKITPFKNIILPIDLTKPSIFKVSKAILLAKEKQIGIKIISASFHLDDFTIHRLYKELDDVKTEIVKNNIPCSAEIVKVVRGNSSIASIVVDYAKRVDGGLLMIMTKDEISTQKESISPNTMSIIENATIPVMNIVEAY